MQKRNIIASLFVVVFVLAGVANAQFGGERKLVSVPTAVTPEAAKKSRQGGRVTVQITVDESGKVVSVGQASGPDQVCQQIVREDIVALREAAKELAANAIYEPAPSGTGDQIVFLVIEFEGQNNLSKVPRPNTGKETETYYSAATEKEKESVNKYTVIGTPTAPPPEYSGPVNTGDSVKTTSDADKAEKNTFTITNKAIPGPLASGKSLSGGVLNGKASKLPKPAYPPAARAVRASGAVTIQVLITEEGRVFAAGAVSGHPLLRSAARIAACGAEFQPTILSGNPVKVSGVITYNFVAP